MIFKERRLDHCNAVHVELSIPDGFKGFCHVYKTKLLLASEGIRRVPFPPPPFLLSPECPKITS